MSYLTTVVGFQKYVCELLLVLLLLIDYSVFHYVVGRDISETVQDRVQVAIDH